MKLRRTIASFCLLGLFVCFGSASKAASMYGKVIEIVDGDSIVIESFNRPVKIELMGIDAPELKQNYGDVARQHLLDLVFDKTVTVEYFGLGEDGSIAGKVFLNRIDVAAQMVRDGVAWYDKGNANRLSETERQVYKDSEQAARNEQRGIWQESKPLAPWDFRQNPTIATVTQTPGKAESASSVARPVRSLSNDDLGLERFSQSGISHPSPGVSNAGDKVLSIDAKDLFRKGPINIVNLEVSTVGQLPIGFDFYEAYEIRSEAIAVGHDVTFKVSSVNDPLVFSSLRVLHFEEDDMHPTRGRWVDRTDLNSHPPNFESKTISASTYQLGRFVVAKKDGVRISKAPVIDLAVNTNVSRERVASGSSVLYTTVIHNKGHNTATEVVMANIIDMRLRIVSATSLHGVCKRSHQSDDTVMCDLNNITPGASAVTTIEAILVEGGPVETLKLNHTAIVRAKERQANSPNAEAVINSTVRLAQ
jgi:uncharacterized repeat protein (TIGR01451 family)